MRQSWIRVSVLLHKDAKLVALPSDAARFSWIVTLCEGKFTEPPGIWQNEAHFRAALGGRSRWLPAFLEAGLMEQTEGGKIRVKNWEKWQSDPSVTERVRKHRRNAAETA